MQSMEPPMDRIQLDLLTWRQDTQLYRLLHSVQCSVALGTGVLSIGIIITVVSLKDYEDDSKIFLVGPVLMTVGILGMTRAVIHHFKRREMRRSAERRRRRRERQALQRNENEAAVYLSPPYGEEVPYPDEPPPYDALSAVRPNVHVTMPTLPPYEGLSNPALDLNYAPPPAYEEIIGAAAAPLTHQVAQQPKTEHQGEPSEPSPPTEQHDQCASKPSCSHEEGIDAYLYCTETQPKITLHCDGQESS